MRFDPSRVVESSDLSSGGYRRDSLLNRRLMADIPPAWSRIASSTRIMLFSESGFLIQGAKSHETIRNQ